MDVVNECLAEEGWHPTADGSGTYFEYPASQEEAFNLASYTCSARYPVEQKYMEPLSDEQARMLYSHYVDVLTPCLEREGYQVDGEPPSVEVFVADPTAWDPLTEVEQQLFEDIASGKYASYLDFETVCPPAPSDDVLYGDS